MSKIYGSYEEDRNIKFCTLDVGNESDEIGNWVPEVHVEYSDEFLSSVHQTIAMFKELRNVPGVDKIFKKYKVSFPREDGNNE